MIVKKQLKNGKISVTSSFFDDLQLYRASLTESKQSDFVSKKWRRDKARDFSDLEYHTAIECLKLARYGCLEIAEFAGSLTAKQLEAYTFRYGPCRPYESYEDLLNIKHELESKENLSTKEANELVRVTNAITEIDNFVKVQVEKF